MKIVPIKVNGILLLDKPLGLTSNAALQKVKRLFNAKKAGHTGSLDPLATGMLPLCFGEATRVSQFLLDSDKYYRVTVILGVKTTTGDAEGSVIVQRPVENVTSERIKEVFQQFQGAISQIPPMYSAVKFQGKPLYRLARQGVEVERKPRIVTIHSLDLMAFSGESFEMAVRCSKGTYVRTLAEDIGELLGCGAHVGGLRRLEVFPYQAEGMHTLEELEAAHAEKGPAALKAFLLPIDTSVQHLPPVRLTSSGTFYLRMGQAVMVPHLPMSGWVRLIADDGRFMGIGEITDDGKVAPRRLLQLPVSVPKAVG